MYLVSWSLLFFFFFFSFSFKIFTLGEKNAYLEIDVMYPRSHMELDAKTTGGSQVKIGKQDD